VYAKELAPQFDINKWIVASRYLQGNGLLLERVNLHIEVLKDILQSEYGSQNAEADGRATGVLTGEQFQDLLRDAKLGLSEHDLDLITVYAIKGSRRLHSGDSSSSNQPVNTKLDLIQFFNFERALDVVIKHLRKEEDDKRRKIQQMDQFDDEVSKMRKELERREKEQLEKEARMQDPM
jgi:isopropylmalate/homocitrate/citramalate synthase